MMAMWQRAARGLAVLAMMGALASCHRPWKLDAQDIDVQKMLPPLQFALTDAETGKTVTAAQLRGKVVMLYFGYTNCPNVCPLTLYDVTRMFHSLGKSAGDVRLLFVTVDPNRDRLTILNNYVALFGSPEILGLRGDPAQLRAVAARYHAEYAVHPSPDPAKYSVIHSAAVYVFNREGKPEFVIAGLSSQNPDLPGITRDLQHLIDHDSV
jgi:protein SCO1